jgi:hypothetical protein
LVLELYRVASFVVMAVLKILDGFTSDMFVFIMYINTYELQANKGQNVVNLRLRILAMAFAFHRPCDSACLFWKTVRPRNAVFRVYRSYW